MIGEELKAVLRQLEVDVAPLSRPGRQAASAEEAARKQAARIAELQNTVKQASRDVRRATRSHVTAVEDLAEARATGSDDLDELLLDVEDAATRLRTATQTLTDAESALTEHQSCSEAPTTGPCQAPRGMRTGEALYAIWREDEAPVLVAGCSRG